ncbi:MAG: hypothetical protein K8U03_26775 [Planctomycetia bacterium]|nr:hypothetical protein [Planctomycetia bacterium]
MFVITFCFDGGPFDGGKADTLGGDSSLVEKWYNLTNGGAVGQRFTVTKASTSNYPIASRYAATLGNNDTEFKDYEYEIVRREVEPTETIEGETDPYKKDVNRETFYCELSREHR